MLGLNFLMLSKDLLNEDDFVGRKDSSLVNHEDEQE